MITLPDIRYQFVLPKIQPILPGSLHGTALQFSPKNKCFGSVHVFAMISMSVASPTNSLTVTQSRDHLLPIDVRSHGNVSTRSSTRQKVLIARLLKLSLRVIFSAVKLKF